MLSRERGAVGVSSSMDQLIGPMAAGSDVPVIRVHAPPQYLINQVPVDHIARPMHEHLTPPHQLLKFSLRRNAIEAHIEVLTQLIEQRPGFVILGVRDL